MGGAGRGALLAAARHADADGHRMGEGRPQRRAVSRAGAARDRPRAARPDGPGALPPRRARASCWSRAEASARRLARGLPASSDQRRIWSNCSRRGARHRDDRSRLGAGDEARGGGGHRPRRPHLPRRDRQPRAGHTRDRRHRNGHLVDHDRRRRHRVVRRRRRRLRLSRSAADPCRADEPRGPAASTHAHDDERRESRRGVLVVVPAQRRRRPGAPRVHHRNPRPRAPDGAAAARTDCRPEAATGD